jgi:predicted dehydrogenase
MKKVIVVGFGFMGLSHTINILKNRKLQLVAIVDKDAAGIEKKLDGKSGNFSTGNITKESLGGVSLVQDFGDCLQHIGSDACFICVHTDLHDEMARKALNAGKHVFLEKPLCLDIRKGAELIAVAREKKRLFMVGQVVRFMPAYLKLKNWIRSGEFGNLKFLSLSRFAGVPLWGDWKEKQQSFGSTGGALFDLVLHDIDFAQSVLGRPDSVKSTVLPGRLSNYDYVSALWKYNKSGIQVKIEGGNTFHSTFPFQAGYAAEFDRASILYTTFQPDFISISTDNELNKIEAGDSNEGFSAEVEYFASCMEDNIPPLICMPESSLETVRICYDHLNQN